MCRSGHLSLVAIFGVLLLGGTHAPFRLLAGWSKARKNCNCNVADSEGSALVSPVERDAAQEQLDGQGARLAALNDGLHDVGGQISEPQKPADVGIAEPKALRNLGGIDDFTLPQRAHPGPGARERQDECLIDPAGLRSRSARNAYLLAFAGTGRRES